MAKEMRVVNLTPHVVRLNSGEEFPPSGEVAHVGAYYSQAKGNPPVAWVEFGEISGLPAPQPGVLYVTSARVAQAAGRNDVVSPATGHPAAVRDEQGRPYSVPCFLRQ